MIPCRTRTTATLIRPPGLFFGIFVVEDGILGVCGGGGGAWGGVVDRGFTGEGSRVGFGLQEVWGSE